MTEQDNPTRQSETVAELASTPPSDPDQPDPRLESPLQEAEEADPRLWSILEKAAKPDIEHG